MLFDPSWTMISLFGFELGYYPFFFGSGFLVALFITKWIVRSYFAKMGFDADKASVCAESGYLAFLVGAMVGARLGHLFFYRSLAEIAADPLCLIRIHEGGLASHGGIIGIIIALFFWLRHYRRYFTPLTMFDLATVPAMFGAGMIRIGNFFNQELVGRVTGVPWAVTFMHPVDAEGGVSRHPVQLYESLFYFLVFSLLLTLYRERNLALKQGTLLGLTFTSVFTFRFLIEFWKEPHGYYTASSPLLMGQILSLPLIAVGIILLWRARRASCLGS